MLSNSFSAIGGTLENVNTGEYSGVLVLALLVMAILVIGFVVFVERGQRRITVNYAKRQQGRKVFAAQSSPLPLKLNVATQPSAGVASTKSSAGPGSASTEYPLKTPDAGP